MHICTHLLLYVCEINNKKGEKMKRVYREYKGVEITCIRTPLSIDSDYYNSMYHFRLNGKLNVTHKLKDAKTTIDRKLKEVA